MSCSVQCDSSPTSPFKADRVQYQLYHSHPDCIPSEGQSVFQLLCRYISLVRLILHLKVSCSLSKMGITLSLAGFRLTCMAWAGVFASAGNRLISRMLSCSESGEEVSITLEESETEKDLGVLVDNRLSFKGHVAQVTAKANKTLGIIRRSFEHLDREVFVQLYKSLVRPILEYGHSVWQPQQKLLCKEIEDVQRRATKPISALSEKTYPERLAVLKLPSLEHRRLRGDMIDLYKYMHGIYDTGNPNFQLAETKDTRGNSLKLYKPFCRLNVRSCFFAERVIPHWNSLPETVVTAPSVNSFKGRLDNFWADRPEKFSPTCYQ